MKRLLSYLFIVTGFVMMFSTNSHAKLIFCVDITKNISKVDKPVTVIRKYSLTKKIECKQIANNYSFEIDKKSPVYKNIKKEFKKRSNGSRPRNKNYTLDEFKALVGSQNFYLFKNYDDVLKTTTASASLITKICEKYKKQWKKQTYEYCKSFDYTKSKYYKANSMAGKSFNLNGRIVLEQDYVRYKESDAFNKNKNFTKDLANLFAQKKIAKAEPKKENKNIDLNSVAALIDKAKESETNFTVSSNSNSLEKFKQNISYENQLTSLDANSLRDQIYSCWSVPIGLPYDNDFTVRVKLQLKPDGTIEKLEMLDHVRMNKPGQEKFRTLADSVRRAIQLCSPLSLPKDKYSAWKELVLNFSTADMIGSGASKNFIAKKEPSQTQKVANKEIKFCVNEVSPYYTSVDGHKYKIRRFDNPYINCNSDFIIDDNYKDDLFYAYLVETVGIVDTRRFSKLKPPVFWKPKNPIKPKKKVKVAKKEEFKPDNKDNEAPVIEIAEAITVNDSTYEIEGKVIDKSKKLFVLIDGETIPVRNGKFKVKRFSPVDEQLKIVAIDQWGNKSKPKLVNITIDIKGTELVEKLEQLNPSLIKSKPNKNRVALIIGIEKYEQTPDANFANLDAKYFYEYARKGFGISKANINLLVDEDASLIKSISTINKWLPSKIKKNQTELIIFFAGHGLASNDGKELYLLPQDSDPDLLSRTALSRTELFEQIIKLSPKSVTMFMDTCYSGISRDEKMLLASARPIRIVASDKDGIPDNFTIFSASKLDQISSGLKEAEHGIFSYFLMKGLEGKADLNKDKEITNGELLAYMDQNVSQKASELGRQQNPSLAGDPDKVLMSYR